MFSITTQPMRQGGSAAAARLWAAAAAAAAGPARCLAAERERWSLWLPVGFAAGIATYFWLPFEPPVWPAVAAVVGLLVAAVLLRHDGRAVLVAVVLLAPAAGFLRAELRTVEVSAPVLERTLYARVSGIVAEVEALPEGPRVIVASPAIDRLAAARTPARVRIALRPGGVTPAPGDWLGVRAVLRPPPPPAAPGAYDFQRRAWFLRLGGIGYAIGPHEVEPAAPSGWALALARWRDALSGRIRATLPGSAGGIAAAMLTGDRAGIGDGANDAMRAAALAHLLAISGLHMGLVAGCVFFVVRLLLALWDRAALRLPAKKLAAVAALVFAAGYLLVSGAAVPAQRAFLMTAVALSAVLLDRTAISMRLVAWAAVAVLLREPESLLGASFQLSFAAVIGLVALYELPGVRRFAFASGGAGPVTRMDTYVAALAASAVAANLATAPFSLFHFQQVAVYGVLANMAAVPLAGFWIMPFGVAALALAPAGLEGLALVPMGWGIDALLWLASHVSALPAAMVTVAALPSAALVAVSAAGLWLCLWRGRWRLLGVPAAAAALVAGLMLPAPRLFLSDDGRLVGFRDDRDVLWLSTLGRDRFVAEAWQRMSGARTLAELGDGAADPAAPVCDAVACAAVIAGRTVVIARRTAALEEDCRRADILLSLVPVRRKCPGPALLITPRDRRANGAHVVWIDGAGQYVWEDVKFRGERPWVAQRKMLR